MIKMKRDTKEHNRLVNQSDAILYFLQRMDIEMINDILDDGRTYQGFRKSLFIHKLGNAFDEFIEVVIMAFVIQKLVIITVPVFLS